jgi:hypothetical protein
VNTEKERSVSRRRGPHSGVRPHGTDGEPDLLDHVRDLLRAGDQVGVVMLASTIVSALEQGPALPFQGAQADDGLSLADLVDSFIDVREHEMTAMLAALAALVTDDVLHQHIRRELDRRGGPLPAGLAPLEPLSVDRTVVATHVLGHVDTLVIGVLTAGGQPLTIVVTVDHELGTLVADGFAYPGPAKAAITRLPDDDPDVTVADIDPADARARIVEAIETGRITYPPVETDTWPACRPLVEWVLRALPEGGSGCLRPELDEPQRQEIARRFLASTHGRQHDDPDGRGLLDTLLWYGCDYGTGDPLTWSPEAVAILLDDWLPRKVIAEPDYLDLAPDLLRDFIRFAHEERGLREQLTEDALEILDALEPEYRRVIRTQRPQGPAALMTAMGWLEDDATGGGPFGDPGIAEGAEGHHRALLELLDELLESVGGEETLAGLSTDPLPDDPFDWDPVPGDIRGRVGEVLGLLDRCAGELFDVEFRTAVRRLLADIVAADAGIFRRRGRADTAAAAIAWIVGKANELFDAHGDGLAIGDLTRWFGLSGSPSQRAGTMLASLGIATDAYDGMHLGTPRYLTSEHRRRIIQRRDIAEAGLGSDDITATDGWKPPEARGVASFRGGPANDRAPWEDPDRVGPPVALDLGADPAPPAPWREPEPVDVLAVGWFPPGSFEDAVDRWPELAARVGTREYATYARIVQGTMIDVAREHARHPVLVPLDLEELPPMADEAGLEVADWRTRAALAASLAEADQGVAWPPGRNEPCWCGSGRKYKKCCDTVALDPARRPTPTDGLGGAQAYELDITLVGARPRIWRRIAIAADATFGDLHQAIQVACGWDNSHLFAFRTPSGTEIGGSPYEDPFGDPHPDAAEVPLAGYFTEHDRCQYEYDFGDGWLHDIRAVRRIEEPVGYRQQLLDGARAFPPEDCGGLPGYEQCLEVVTGGADPDDLREWLGDWDPERFDLAELKQRFNR